MRKECSTNVRNEEFLFTTCELNSALGMISGRWKAQILLSIYEGNNRFSLLFKDLENVSEQVLSRQLKNLEKDHILVKIPIPDTVPPGIEYGLTAEALELMPILNQLCDWGKKMNKFR